MIRIEQEDDGKKGRFVLYEDDKFAGEMTYTWAGSERFIIDHTSVDEAFGGKGYGKKLVLKAVEFARDKEVKILPLCPYAKTVLERDKAHKDVLF